MKTKQETPITKSDMPISRYEFELIEYKNHIHKVLKMGADANMTATERVYRIMALKGFKLDLERVNQELRYI
jgi:hypothetical protein